MAVWVFFFSAALTSQNSPELKIHIINVAQDTSVYYSVHQHLLIISYLFQQGSIFEDKFYLCREDKFDPKFHFLAHPLQQILQRSSS